MKENAIALWYLPSLINRLNPWLNQALRKKHLNVTRDYDDLNNTLNLAFALLK